jgi:hypothetical protein
MVEKFFRDEIHKIINHRQESIDRARLILLKEKLDVADISDVARLLGCKVEIELINAYPCQNPPDAL